MCVCDNICIGKHPPINPIFLLFLKYGGFLRGWKKWLSAHVKQFSGFLYAIFLKTFPLPIQSTGCNVLYLLFFVPFGPIDDQNWMDWRLLVKKHISKLTKLGNLIFYSFEEEKMVLKKKMVYVIGLKKQYTVYSVEVSWERVCGCGCWCWCWFLWQVTYDMYMWRVTSDTWNVE